ncbi:MAG: DNA methyltransferase, partial [Anaerolineae bacterium]|nr:DNA methyltransferase [Anaerolineae bacterium]
LPAGFKGDVFVPFLSHESSQVRYWAVKSIGKARDTALIERLADVARHDPDSNVRREAISAIGRMRRLEAIPLLISQLDERDPKVLLQVIRALLVFGAQPEVQAALIRLRDHPNELIQSVIQRAFEPSQAERAERHVESPICMRNVVVHGDALAVLPCAPDESIHLTFTSPPYYNARDYSIYQSYTAYLDFLTEVFKQIHRLTKTGRFLIVNTSPIILPRMSRAHASKRYPIPFDLHARLVQIGWEFVDDIIWLKPESSVKNRNAGFSQHRKPLGYKPNPVTEYLMVYRKQSDKLIDWNMRQYPPEIVQASRVCDQYETSNVWRIDPASDRVHSAVFPLELCQRVVCYYSYVGDLVCDPFGGSGTLGKAARLLDRHFFMVEKEALYIERMREVLGEAGLFDSAAVRFLSAQEFKEVCRTCG